MNEDLTQSYNKIYERIVQRDDDLVGLIAYALYKQHKRDWLIGFKKARNASPNDIEVNAYLIGEGTEGRINAYRDQAARALNNFADQIITAATPNIQKIAIEGRIENSTKWHNQIFGGIVAAFIYTVISICILLVIKIAGVDILSLAKTLSGGS